MRKSEILISPKKVCRADYRKSKVKHSMVENTDGELHHYQACDKCGCMYVTVYKNS